MTEGKKSSKSSQKLLALNPSEDAEFQKKVQQVKKKKTRPGSVSGAPPRCVHGSLLAEKGKEGCELCFMGLKC